jgi:hypothetical protein
VAAPESAGSDLGADTDTPRRPYATLFAKGEDRRQRILAVAERLLARWDDQPPAFVKVMPRDYKRVLGAIRDAEEAGADIDEAIMAAAKG